MLPNTTERDLQTSLQNYNNLLEQQIFENEEGQEQDVANDESRNLSLQGMNGASKGSSGCFQMKENRGDQTNLSQS